MGGGGGCIWYFENFFDLECSAGGEGERGKVCFTKLQMNGTSNTSLSSIHWGRGKLHIELRKLLRFRVFNRVGGGGVFYHTTKEQNFKNFFDLEYSGGGEVLIELQKLLRFRVSTREEGGGKVCFTSIK